MAIFFIWQTICHHASNVDHRPFMAKFLKAISLGKWKEIAQGEGVGHKRIQIFKPVAAAKFRFVVKEVEGAVNIKQLALY